MLSAIDVAEGFSSGPATLGLGVQDTAGVEVLPGRQGRPVDGLERRVKGVGLLDSSAAVTSNDVADVKSMRSRSRSTDQSYRHSTGRGQRIGPCRPRAPQYRRDLVADKAIEEAPSLLGVDEAQVEVADLWDGLGDRGRRDLAKDHALHWHLGIQDLLEVPGDGLALAVFVGREVELVDLL